MAGTASDIARAKADALFNSAQAENLFSVLENVRRSAVVG